MTGKLYTADHQIFALPPLLSWRVTHTGTVPCDSFSVTFVYQKEMAQALKTAAGFVAEEEGEVMLRAVVDEYTVDLDGNGLTATVSGRGYAARLLDNESRPVTYQQATLAEILQNHAEPYGITCGEIAEVRAASAYTVAAGSSQWKAVESFCRACGGFVPRFSREGELLASPEQAGRTLSIGEGDPVLACTLREDHYGVLTEALVIDKTQNQEFSVKNQEMIDKGGQCRRVLYTPGQSTWAAMRYTGEYQIQRSGEDAWTAEVTLPGSFLAFPGDRVSLSLERMGLSGTFRVAEAENRFDGGNGALVTLTLKPLKT
ncbi:hypothetical protein [Oscillibacter sp.]|uniref:hypothetical protein n=1 Tax=Oscillibacter sp. TaxID=1945593 RepID=UPI00216F84B9|nr:hypothetical protein [Oscillibacter sp.]MCI9239851.1 hypothetical protein [Oscillibacter sp.]